MKSKKTTTTTTVSKDPVTRSAVSLFDKENRMWMIAGAVVMILGFLLMAGGRSEDPNVFDVNEVYSTRRITIAPILILAGLVLLVIAIFRHPRKR